MNRCDGFTDYVSDFRRFVVVLVIIFFVAIYIDIEDEEQREENRVYSRWFELPDLLLEKIFSYLSIRDKYYASLVCKSWYRAFYLPYVWSQFVLEDTTLTRGRFNYYSGWQVVALYHCLSIL